MFHQSNSAVVATRFMSAVLRVILVWPGVVLAIFGFMFFMSTLGDDGRQRATDMAATAQNYRAAPAGSVMFWPCPFPQNAELAISVAPSSMQINKQDCRPYPLTFAEAAARERRIILGAGSALFAFGVIAELSSVLIRHRQRYQGGHHE
ncbi:hypothetical protein J4G53_21845 [Serratia ureilytica]|uniref:hypothetical protein n=1 Tax=Serratia ureilytica TaxID=300181 RepID=UPI001AA119D3|nr:hypothetical protein [Serratia ureilytica]MBO1810900.1 hypothetical protein [Serratia ureilytica]